MSDPQPTSLTRKPRRAEPLQPDKPGQGDSTQPSTPAGAERGEQRRNDATREEQAIENVKTGYD